HVFVKCARPSCVLEDSELSRKLEQIRSTILLSRRTANSCRRALRSPTEASPRRQQRPIVHSPQASVAARRLALGRNVSRRQVYQLHLYPRRPHHRTPPAQLLLDSRAAGRVISRLSASG